VAQPVRGPRNFNFILSVWSGPVLVFVKMYQSGPVRSWSLLKCIGPVRFKKKTDRAELYSTDDTGNWCAPWRRKDESELVPTTFTAKTTAAGHHINDKMSQCHHHTKTKTRELYEMLWYWEHDLDITRNITGKTTKNVK
jgi:hypothetical protein